jgi:hypothetical protein
MGLGTDDLGWMLADLPEPSPWLMWPTLPQVPAQRAAEPELSGPAPLPTQQARQQMAPWANRLDLPGIGV